MLSIPAAPPSPAAGKAVVVRRNDQRQLIRSVRLDQDFGIAHRAFDQRDREALRAAIESTKDLPGSHGIFNMSANDHSGLDQRARVMVEIVGGQWKLAKD